MTAEPIPCAFCGTPYDPDAATLACERCEGMCATCRPRDCATCDDLEAFAWMRGAS